MARKAIVEKAEGLDSDDPDWASLVPLLAAWLRAPRPPAGIFPLLLRVWMLIPLGLRRHLKTLLRPLISELKP